MPPYVVPVSSLFACIMLFSLCVNAFLSILFAIISFGVGMGGQSIPAGAAPL
jgi:hypothetical protein